MEPTPFNDVRTIWFGSGQRPRATTDYEILLERQFKQLVEQSITKFPNLWTPDEWEAKTDKNSPSRCTQLQNYISTKLKKERVIGHYCIIKPFPARFHEFLEKICAPYGFIVDKKITKSKIDGQLIGVVDFKNKEDAERAAKAVNGMDAGDGTVLSAWYLQKKKRSKALDLLAERRSAAPVERKKQVKVQPKMSGSETNLLMDLSQQWAYFSENGSVSLNALIWNMPSIGPPVTTVHKPITSQVPLDEEIKKTLDELEKDMAIRAVRKLRF